MLINEIYDMWDKDCVIDRSELAQESINTSKTHNKYLKIFFNERLILLKLEADMKVLKKEKYIFYKDGPSKETNEKGWKYPPNLSSPINTTAQQYVDADEDIIELSLKIGYQKEKIELIDAIIKSLNNRGFAIKNAIDFMRWTRGSDS
jgi:hypothetical protein